MDDDEFVCTALKLLMGTHGFEVQTFPCAEGFLCAAPNSAPGCLVMDVHMPGLDGWKAHQKLRESGSTRPVIFISAHKDGNLEEKALKAGAVGFLEKPFNDHALVDLIKLAFDSVKSNMKNIYDMGSNL